MKKLVFMFVAVAALSRRLLIALSTHLLLTLLLLTQLQLSN